MASDAIVIAVGGPPWAVFEAEAQLHALERRWSRFLTNSDISRLNRDASATVDPETLVLIDIMQQAAVLTEGAFDPTLLRALVRAGYASSIDQPDRTTILPELDAPAVACSIAEVSVDPGTARVTLPPDLVLDAGGIGKGLAADLVVERLLDTGAVGALAGIGGDLCVRGTPPSPDGWTIAVEDPFDLGANVVTVTIDQGGVATSSTRSRRWIHEGSEQHHHVDPRTNECSATDLAAVTVVAPTGWLAEAHASAALLAGADQVMSYLSTHGLDGLAITTDGYRLATGGFQERHEAGTQDDEPRLLGAGSDRPRAS